MNPKTFIPILLFLFLALSGGSVLCETSKEKARDDYTILFNLINESNAITSKAMNEYSAINSKAINECNRINFTLVMTLHCLLFIYITFAIGYAQKIIFKQQRQIDDLKRELEEMKKQSEPQS